MSTIRVYSEYAPLIKDILEVRVLGSNSISTYDEWMHSPSFEMCCCQLDAAGAKQIEGANV